MSSIGPQIPPHLLAQFQRPETDVDDSEDESTPQPNTVSVAPQIPRLHPTHSKAGPTFPLQRHDSDDDDDDDIGPKPVFAGPGNDQPDPIREFMEKEEKRKKAVQEALKPKAPKREEWMLVPPTSSSLLGNLDPTKHKGRQFSRGKATGSDNDMSLWTETPAERQQRLNDEVQGKRRRVTDTTVNEDDEDLAKKRRRTNEEAKIRKGVEEYTRQRRGPALVAQHQDAMVQKLATSEKEESPGIWDHTRDMGIGGRLMDDHKRSKMLKEARGLGDRFNSGESGGFL